ncbi:MAG TPA: MBL fold metallo-hydrolase [Pyrinomonadaceae bacterium]|jgi:beta-lactamase superfamily II metal-dependent hydrolase
MNIDWLSSSSSSEAKVYKLGVEVKQPVQKLDISTRLPQTNDNNTKSNKMNVVPESEVLIHHIDVGQGEATLIVYRVWGENALVVLVDGGRKTRGGGTAIRHLQNFGIDRIDAMVCTHYDADHIEGLYRILQHHTEVEVNTVFERSLEARAGDNAIDQFRKAAENREDAFRKALPLNAKIVPVTKLKPSFSLTCLHVDAKGEMQSDNSENNCSIALLLEYGKFRYYTGGDLEIHKEDALAAQAKGAKHLCAFKAGHHGSKHSTSKDFLEKTEAQVAFISCGHHSYCHPDDEVLQRLSESKFFKQVYLTNCCYNRDGINPNFLETEAGVVFSSAKQRWENAFKLYKRATELVSSAQKIGETKDEETKRNLVNKATEFETLVGETVSLIGEEKEKAEEVISNKAKREEVKTLTDKTLEKAKEAREAINEFVNLLTAGLELYKKKDIIANCVKWSVNVVEEAEATIDADKIAENASKTPRKKFGRVAGDSEHFGSILLHVMGDEAKENNHVWRVGWWDSQYWADTDARTPDWTWAWHQCVNEQRNMPADDKSFDDVAKNAVQLEYLNEMEVPGSPGTWGKDIGKNRNEDYALFTKPTKVSAEFVVKKEYDEDELKVRLGTDEPTPDYRLYVPTERERYIDLDICKKCKQDFSKQPVKVLALCANEKCSTQTPFHEACLPKRVGGWKPSWSLERRSKWKCETCAPSVSNVNNTIDSRIDSRNVQVKRKLEIAASTDSTEEQTGQANKTRDEKKVKIATNDESTSTSSQVNNTTTSSQPNTTTGTFVTRSDDDGKMEQDMKDDNSN